MDSLKRVNIRVLHFYGSYFFSFHIFFADTIRECWVVATITGVKYTFSSNEFTITILCYTHTHTQYNTNVSRKQNILGGIIFIEIGHVTLYRSLFSDQIHQYHIRCIITCMVAIDCYPFISCMWIWMYFVGIHTHSFGTAIYIRYVYFVVNQSGEHIVSI